MEEYRNARGRRRRVPRRDGARQHLVWGPRAVGAALGRWWALALPLAWAALSIGAEGYDIPVATGIAFQTPFMWAPALALGVCARRLGGPLFESKLRSS